MLLGCNQAEAEDLVQSVLLRCFCSWKRVAAATDRDAYVFRMLLNCYFTSRVRGPRGEVSLNTHLEQFASVDNVEIAVTTTQTLYSAIRRLSKDHRMIVVLRFYADLAEHQVAQVLGIPVGTVKSRTSRALAQLSTFLVPSSGTTKEL